MCQIISVNSPIPNFMAIHPTVHKLFHAYTGAYMMVLVSNMVGYESIISISIYFCSFDPTRGCDP